MVNCPYHGPVVGEVLQLFFIKNVLPAKALTEVKQKKKTRTLPYGKKKKQRFSFSLKLNLRINLK